MIRKTGIQNQKPDQVLVDWDGIDRRQQERRNLEILENEIAEKAAAKQPSFLSKFGSILATVISVIVTLIGFGSSLYNRVSNLEVKIETIKIDVSEIKNVIKEEEKARKILDDHISSIEETMMQLYRQKK